MDNQILLEEYDKRNPIISFMCKCQKQKRCCINAGLEDWTATLPTPVRGGKDEDAAQRLQRP